MTWREFIRAFRPGQRPTAEEQRAMDYLERRGQRFLVHFGFVNAIEKARQDWRERKAAARKSVGL